LEQNAWGQFKKTLLAKEPQRGSRALQSHAARSLLRIAYLSAIDGYSGGEAQI
jgi:hypothetical protein